MQKQVATPKPITLGIMESIHATSGGRLPTRRRSQLLWALVDVIGLLAAIALVALVLVQVSK